MKESIHGFQRFVRLCPWMVLRLCPWMVLMVGALMPPSIFAKSSDWQEFTSQHFTVYSDRKTAEAKALLQDFERFRAAALAITGLPSSDETQRPQIFLFRR